MCVEVESLGLAVQMMSMPTTTTLFGVKVEGQWAKPEMADLFVR